jgi:hypothetical protein
MFYSDAGLQSGHAPLQVDERHLAINVEDPRAFGADQRRTFVPPATASPIGIEQQVPLRNLHRYQIIDPEGRKNALLRLLASASRDK